MNLRARVRFVRAFAKVASMITRSPHSILSRVRTAGAFAAAGALAGVLLATSSTTATIIYNLGTLGGSESYGTAVNDAGQVAGYSIDTAYPAFRYAGTPGSGGIMRDLGTLGGTYALGSAVNRAGQVAGSSYLTGDMTYNAFRYDGTPGSGGVMRNL